MPRKKKAVVVPDSGVKGPEVRDGRKYLSKQDLTTLEFARLRVEHHFNRLEQLALERAVSQFEAQADIRAVEGVTPDMAEAIFEILRHTKMAAADIKESHAKARGRLALANKDLAWTLQLLHAAYDEDFTKISYDAHTGLLHLL